MLKHFFFIIALSLLVIAGLTYFHRALLSLLQAHTFVIHTLDTVFSGGVIGTLIKRSLALLLIPLAFGCVVSGLYWVFRRTHTFYVIPLTWTVWLILATALAMHF